MTLLAQLNVVWLTGANCDGCSISVLGDDSVAPIEDLLSGRVKGLPRIRLIHPVLSVEEGDRFVAHFRRAATGGLRPFVLVVETSLPAILGAGSFAWMSEENEKLVDLRDWVVRLASEAEAVIAIGDCAVFGGPHSGELTAGPTEATGVESVLGFQFRSRANLPVIHLPGCSIPPVFMATVTALIRYLQGEAPAPDLDELGRPMFAYAE